MIDTTLRRSHRTTAVVIALLVTGLFLTGLFVQPILAGDDANSDRIEIERSGDELIVAIDGEFDTGTLSISSGEDELAEESIDPDGERTEKQFRLFDFDFGELDDDLSNGTVSVTIERQNEAQNDDEEGEPTNEYEEIDNKEVHMDLRAIEFDDFGLDGTNIQLQVSDVVGVADAVAIDINDGAWANDVFLDDNTLSVSLLEVAEQNVNIYDDLTVVAFPEDETGADIEGASEATTTRDIQLQDLSDDSPELKVDDENLYLEYDIIFENIDYDVTVDADNEQEDFEREGEEGKVPLEKETVLSNGPATVMVEQDGQEVFEEAVRVPFDDDYVLALATDVIGEQADVEETRIIHPLLFEGEEYVLAIETADPEAKFFERLEVDDAGGVGLSDDAQMALMGEVRSISIDHQGGGTIAEVSPDEFQVEVPTLNATVDDDVLTINESIEGDTVWLRFDDEITTLSAEQIESSENDTSLTAAQIAPAVNETGALFIDTGGEVVERVDLNVVDSDGEDAGMFAILPRPDAGLLLFALSGVVGITALVLAIGDSVTRRFIGRSSPYRKILTIVLLFHVFVILFVMGVLQWLSTLQAGFPFLAGVLIGTLLVASTRAIFKRSLSELVQYGLALLIWLLGALLLVLADFAEVLPVTSLNLGIAVAGSGYGLVVVAPTIMWSERRRSAGGTTTGASQPKPVTATVEIHDGVSRRQVNQPVELVVRKQMSHTQTHRTQVTGGRTTIDLQPGKWVFEVHTGDTKITHEATVRKHQRTVTVELPGRTLTVQVRKRGEQKPIPGADVRISSPQSQFSEQSRTDRQGTYRVTVPFTVQTVEAVAEHDLFKPLSQNVALRSTESVALDLVPREGALRVDASLGRQPVAGLSVTARRQGEVKIERSGTTDSRGTVQFSDVLIGRYNFSVALPVDSNAFEVSTSPASVREDRTSECRIDVRFNYSLSHQHRSHIRELREELNQISQSSRRDNAIQTYYASVLHAVLAEIERVPQQGYVFFEHNQDPDQIVDALLVATENAIEMIDDVLSSKRNVNLFSACSNLPDVTVEWGGDATMEELLQLTTMGMGQQRAKINTQFETVDNRITGELRELAEVSPAREMWDALRDSIRSQSNLSETEIAASIFVSLLLLHAVESLFEHRELRKRLEQTVY